MNLYNRVSWDWFFSGSSEGMSFDSLAAVFGKWRSLVANTTKCQVAAMGLLARSSGGNRHVHAMLVGKNRHGKSLSDVGPDTVKTLEAAWKSMARSSAVILPAIEKRAVRYIVEDNLLYKRNVEELIPMNVKLLKKLMKEKECQP